MKPYYQDDYTTIYHGDCREILPHLPKVDLVLTDPPYSDAVMTGAMTRADGAPLNGKQFVPFSISEEALREILERAARKLNGWMIVFCDWRHAAAFGNKPPEGLRHVRFGVWNKPDGAPQFTGDRPAPGWEAISIMHTEDRKLKWNGGGRRSVWTYGIEKRNGHPTPKPLDLVQEMVKLFSDQGEVILDPFMGSGTTLVAAKNLGRKAIGIEIEEKYCEIAVKRLRQEVLPFAQVQA